HSTDGLDRIQQSRLALFSRSSQAAPAQRPDKERTMFATRFARRWPRLLAAGLFAAALVFATRAPGQGGQPGKGKGKPKLPDFILADYDDYKTMMNRLGVQKTRPGRDSKVKDTSDESTANPYKQTMPDLMTFKDGTKVTRADQWPKRRA